MNKNEALNNLLKKYQAALDYAQDVKYSFQEHTDYEFFDETNAICGMCAIYDVIEKLKEANDELEELID